MTIKEESIRLFPDAIDTLYRLSKAGSSLALITNGSGNTQRAKIEKFDLAKFFDHVQVEKEVGFGKPDERAFTHALRTLGASTSEA